MTASGESRTETTKTVHILTFNVRSILKLERRTLFANAICTSDYDMLCLCVTETWRCPKHRALSQGIRKLQIR